MYGICDDACRQVVKYWCPPHLLCSVSRATRHVLLFGERPVRSPQTLVSISVEKCIGNRAQHTRCLEVLALVVRVVGVSSRLCCNISSTNMAAVAPAASPAATPTTLVLYEHQQTPSSPRTRLTRVISASFSRTRAIGPSPFGPLLLGERIQAQEVLLVRFVPWTLGVRCCCNC